VVFKAKNLSWLNNMVTLNNASDYRDNGLQAVKSAFHPSGVGKSITGLYGWD